MQRIKISSILLKLPAILTVMISCWLSSKSQLPSPDFDNSDKLVHFVCFGGLAFFWTLWISSDSWRSKKLRSFLIVFALVAVYGACDEVHQYYVPGRSCSFFDWLADISGASLGAVARILLEKIRTPKTV